MMSNTRKVHAAPLAWPEPTSESRPWTRWWWLGSAVDKTNLTRLLEEYHRVGLGGVEVTPIYGVTGQERRDLQYLSDAWVAMLAHTCEEAKRLGMQVDLPPGSGWKMGGANLREDERNADFVIEETPLNSGEGLPVGLEPKRYQAVVAFGPEGAYEHLSSGAADWRAPSAGWTLYALTQRWNRERIKRPGPGGEGWVFNPVSRRSFEAVKPPFETLFAKLPTGALRAQFHDSFEYQGNWCAEFLTEFERRRGYDLRTQLPALTGKGDRDAVARVKTDYRLTYGELLLDNVIMPWADWCHAHGQLARNQGHGSPGNLLDLYGAVDIPETELFRAPDEWTAIMSKFASSAAHVMGRRLCSSESCTWLGEHFTVTLAAAKKALDYQLLSGVNHNVYHGTAYSPADAEWPGWLFYASTQFNPQNPIWRDFGALNEYMTRCQSILQAGEPDNDVLLYWPYADVLRDAKGVRRQFTVHRTDWLRDHAFGQCAKVLWESGYSFDYVSDRQLALLAADLEEILAPGGRYRVLVVPACRSLPLETARRLAALVEQGARVIFQNGIPTDVPGLGQLTQRREELRQLDERLRDRVRRTQDVNQALDDFGVRRESLTDHGLRFTRRRHPLGHDYFVVNQSGKDFDGWIAPERRVSDAVLLDPVTGVAGRAEWTEAPGSGRAVRLQLAVGQSVVLRTLTNDLAPSTKAWQYLQPTGAPLPLTGRWQATFVAGGPVLPPPFEMNVLGSWTAAGSEAERFAGTARYSLTFDLPADHAGDWLLDLGDVRESARVRVNGADFGTLIAPPVRVRLSALKPAGNRLEVEVTNVAANRVRDLDRRGVGWRIFRDINFVNRDYQPFDASNWPVRAAGLLGPVQLVPLQ